MSDAMIRRQVEQWAQAVRSRDVEGVMSVYASEIVSFDLDPPLRYSGTQDKRRAWEAFFAAHRGPIEYEVTELSVACEADLGFVHALNRVRGTLASGRSANLWVRWTACFRRIQGTWLIVHDHVSLPVDLAGGKAVLDSP